MLGGPFTLTDQNGVRRSDADFRGKYMLVFFGYTFCPDVCPTTLAVMAAALDKMGAAADRIVPVFISVDPVARHARSSQSLSVGIRRRASSA